MTTREALETLLDLLSENYAFNQEKMEAEELLEKALTEQEKKDELLNKIKDILALNFSYQEIGIKIARLFKEEGK